MATGQISASFDIVLSGIGAGSGTFTASRSFTLTSIQATNTNNSPSTCDITFAGVRATAGANGLTGVGIIQNRTVTGPNSPVGVLDANSGCAAGAAVVVTTAAATDTQFALRCIANPATAIPVT